MDMKPHPRVIVPAVLIAAVVGCEPRGSQPPAGQSLLTEVQRRRWQTPHGAGVALRSAHYEIFSTADRPALRRYLPGFMEATHKRYLALTGLPDTPRAEPMAIYMLAGRREWAALTRDVFGPKTPALHIEAGGYCHEGVCVFWDIGGTATLSVAAHEGLHQFFHHRLREQLPMWLEEGLCVLAEGHRVDGQAVRFTPSENPQRFTALRSALVNQHWLALPDLLETDAGDVVGRGTQRAVAWYAQVWALARFIQSHPRYRAGLHRLLSDAAAGRFADALGLPAGALTKLRRRGRAYNRTVSVPLFEHYISDDLDTVAAEYRAYAERIADLR
ncbi:MAG: hypothetical protein KGY99_08245 [Phycisphaerae bacterium]|nr:hypothetical protein [Phycisphaerae bacterium]